MLRKAIVLILCTMAFAGPHLWPTLQDFDRAIHANVLGTFVLVQEEGDQWDQGLWALLQEEPLIFFHLPLQIYSHASQGNPMPARLQERYGWPTGPHWAFLDKEGVVIADGATPPTREGLIKAIGKSGVRPITKDLEDFIEKNPDHLQADLALFKERVLVANRRTQWILKPENAKIRPTLEIVINPNIKLSSEDDEKIWRDISMQTTRLLRSPIIFYQGYRGGGQDSELAAIIRYSNMIHSPMMLAALAQHRAALEAEVRRNPINQEVYSLLEAVSFKCGNWSVTPLVRTLVRVPGTDLTNGLSEMMRERYLLELNQAQDWKTLREYLLASWAKIKQSPGSLEGNYKAQAVIIQLAQTYIHLEEIKSAVELVEDVVSKHKNWYYFSDTLQSMATRLNQPELAAKWKALEVQNVRP